MRDLTVGMFKDAGFRFVEGDCIGNMPVNSISASHLNAGDVFDDALVGKLAPRPNKGAQPVGDDCVVYVEFNNDLVGCMSACEFCWNLNNGDKTIKSWSPYLSSIIEDHNLSSEIKSNVEVKEIDYKKLCKNLIIALGGVEGVDSKYLTDSGWGEFTEEEKAWLETVDSE